MAYLHMMRLIMSLIFAFCITVQSLVYLRIAETTVYLRAVEMVAVLGKDNALYLIGVAFILESKIYTLCFQVS